MISSNVKQINSNAFGHVSESKNRYIDQDTAIIVTALSDSGQFPIGEAGPHALHGVSMARLANGKVAAVWEESTNANLKAIILNPDGTPSIPQFDVPFGISAPQVAAFDDGRFVIVATGNDGSGEGSYAQIFDASGVPIGPAFIVNQITSGQSGSPSVVVLSNGKFVVSWTTNDGVHDPSWYGIKARVFGNDGTPATHEFLVNELTKGFQTGSELTAFEDGKFAVLWNNGSGWGKARIFAHDATPLSSEFFVGGGVRPKGATKQDGEAVVVWTSTSSDAKIKFLDDDGSISADPITVNQNLTGSVSDVSVAVLENDKILVSWSVAWQSADEKKDPSGSGVIARLLDAHGNPIGDEFLVNQFTDGTQNGAHAVDLGNGDFLMAWHNPWGGPVSGRIFNAETNAPPVAADDGLGDLTVGETGNAREGFPKTDTLADGKIVVTWEAENGGVKASILNPDGSEAVGEFTVFAELRDPSLATLPDGRFVIASVGDSPVGRAITARIYEADGTPAGGEFVVSQSFMNGSKWNSDIAALPNGKFTIVWEASDIKARVFENDGTPVTDEFTLNVSTAGDQTTPTVHALANGQFASFWTDNYEFSFGGVYDADGTRTANLFAGYGEYPDTVPVGDDGFAAVWLLSGKGLNRPVALKIWDEGGSTVIAETTVNQFPTASSHATATLLQNGKIVVTWASGHTFNDDVSGTGIHARIMNPDGTPAGNEFLVSQITEGNLSFPHVTALHSGGFAIAWMTPQGEPIGARIFDEDGNPIPKFSTDEDTPLDFIASDLLENDTDPDGDGLKIEGVQTTSTQGAAVVLNADGSVTYDPTNSAALAALPDGLSIEDSFSYSVTDGQASDTASVFVTVQGRSDTSTVNFAKDDPITVSADLLDSYDTDWFRIGALNNHTDLLENDKAAQEIVLVNGRPIAPGHWFDGDNGGQFRVFPGGVVDFRNLGTKVSDGDETGFTYTAFDGAAYDTATVSLTVDPSADFAEDDAVTVSADMLRFYGNDWFRVGALNNRTDLLENDPGADAIMYVNGRAIAPGVWFDGDGGGQFRVFPGGVVDFQNRGTKVTDGDSTGFSYTAADASVLDRASVSLAIDADADFAQNDVFSVSAGDLANYGRDWFRVGALNDNTDLLENDGAADAIIFVNGRAIKPGVWFEGDGGGYFRVFPGGVVDFHNRGDKVAQGDTTGFSYTAVDGSLFDTATVSLEITADIQPYQYTSFDGDLYEMVVWEGENIALLVPVSANVSSPVMQDLLDAYDAGFAYYQNLTGQEPAQSTYTINGKGTIAVVDSTCGGQGAGCGFLGQHGIEITNDFFGASLVGPFPWVTGAYDAMADTSTNIDIVFYELGRNFWFFDDDLGDYGFATGYAVTHRYLAGQNSDFEWDISANEPDFFETILPKIAQSYFQDQSATALNTLGLNQGIPNPSGFTGAADLAASLFRLLHQSLGSDLYADFWQELPSSPKASTPEQSFQNFANTAQTISALDVSWLFKDGWTFDTGSPDGETIQSTAATGPHAVLGFGGDDVLLGTARDETLIGDMGDDVIHGDSGNDEVSGGSGNDTIHGEQGDDILFGNAGADAMYGGPGDDTLRGQDGDDRLNGGPGIDILVGGRGSDTFVAKAGDALTVIADYQIGIDTIEIDAGLMEQDQLLMVDDGNDLLIGYGNDEIVLTGLAGTNVDVTIVRPSNLAPEFIGARHLVFEDSFDRPDGPPGSPWVIKNPGAVIDNGILEMVSSGGPRDAMVTAFDSNPTLTDVALEVSIDPAEYTNWTNASVMMRADNFTIGGAGSTGHAYRFDFHDSIPAGRGNGFVDTVNFMKIVDGVASSFKSTPLGDRGSKFDVSINAVKNTLTLTVDDEVVFKFTDTDAQPLDKGGFGFHTVWESLARFDDVALFSISGTEPVFQVARSTQDKTVVGTVLAIDPDGDYFEYAIDGGNTDVNGDGALPFAIDPVTGSLSVNDPSDLAFAARDTWMLDVSATDAGGLSDNMTVTVELVHLSKTAAFDAIPEPGGRTQDNDLLGTEMIWMDEEENIVDLANGFLTEADFFVL